METLPAKAEETFSKSLAVIDSQHRVITINTRSIALEVNKRNGDLNKKIRYLIKNSLIDEGKLSPTYYVDSSNRKQKSYDLDEETALQLVMSLSGTKAELLHKKIAVSFTQMKTELIKWRRSRQDVIEPTKAANDSIKWLSDRLKEEKPGSSSGLRIYQHIQEAIAKCATCNARTKRDQMTTEQLKLVEVLEILVHEKIESLRALGASGVDVKESILSMLKNSANDARIHQK